ncbi:hypothetical protein RJ55_08352 [Drechmeria coniospora]|nr:hypothetical protein RJ55_08352 [Drechmeria coniospora]
MAPRRKQAAAAKPPLEGCTVVLSGRFTSLGHTQGTMEALVRTLGGGTAKTMTAQGITHLVCTEQDYENGSSKVAGARAAGDLPIVKPDWIFECQRQNKTLATDEFLWTTPAPAPVLATASASAASSPEDTATAMAGKRVSASAVKDEAGDEADAVPPVKRRRADGCSGRAAAVHGMADAEEEKGAAEMVVEGQFVKKEGFTIPLDEFCSLDSYQVHVDPGSGMIYDASLNQSSTSNNHNKFYRLQILRDASGGTFRTWTRWGRVGEAGQSAILGNGLLDDALKIFEKKFRDKSGLRWDDRGDAPRPGKYAFVERSYLGDSDEEADAKPAPAAGRDEVVTVADCTLAPPVREVVELIFNQTYFQQTMISLNYDADKLPLGKLSKATILRGFQQLKDLAALMDDASLAASRWETSVGEATERLSNAYYSLIPHVFGRHRPPVINTDGQLRREIELLESLSDMKDAAEMMKIDRRPSVGDVHPLDRQFANLGMQEMSPLDRAGHEFGRLRDYLAGSKGSTHAVDYDVRNIFRIEREGERARFDSSRFATMPSDRRLLWHGSRATNFGGILSQGLRIAPKEAPVSGYMFGKGIYLADMSSKSANYCCSHNSNGHALLLLCEAELGDPMQKLTDASHDAGEDAKAKGLASTMGMGGTGPSRWVDAGTVHESLRGTRMPDVDVKPSDTGIEKAHLYYNEYICYDVAQVRLRYLFHVKM